MRAIKFRAWDHFNDCYWYSDKYPTLAQFFTAMQHLMDGGNELIFEQFTGLHDKNGKEIYEGDIVKKSFHSENEDIPDYDIVFTVEYHGCGFWLISKNMRIGGLSDCELIGNIHENSELL
jgi:uncharacterized phage protein (TIGR01671 family)